MIFLDLSAGSHLFDPRIVTAKYEGSPVIVTSVEYEPEFKDIWTEPRHRCFTYNPPIKYAHIQFRNGMTGKVLESELTDVEVI